MEENKKSVTSSNDQTIDNVESYFESKNTNNSLFVAHSGRSIPSDLILREKNVSTIHDGRRGIIEREYKANGEERNCLWRRFCMSAI